MKRMKKSNIKTETYESGNWRIDIVTTHDKYNSIDAYLYYEGYGVKDLMFGVSLNDNSKKHFLELVEANLEDYQRIYFDEYIANGVTDDLLIKLREESGVTA